MVSGMRDPVPQPRQNDGGGFAQAGRDVDQAGSATGAMLYPTRLRLVWLPFAISQPSLAVEGIEPAGRFEKLVKVHSAFPRGGFGVVKNRSRIAGRPRPDGPEFLPVGGFPPDAHMRFHRYTELSIVIALWQQEENALGSNY